MIYKIDQSGKIEQTNKITVICLANGSWDSIVIHSKTKRQIQEFFRKNGQIKNYVLFTFCAGLSVLLKRNSTIQQVIIDREYYGKEPIIKNILLEMMRLQKNIPIIHFGHIGRRVEAHKKGYLIFKNKIKPKKIVSLNEVLEEIKKTEVGKRLKNA